MASDNTLSGSNRPSGTERLDVMFEHVSVSVTQAKPSRLMVTLPTVPSGDGAQLGGVLAKGGVAYQGQAALDRPVVDLLNRELCSRPPAGPHLTHLRQPLIGEAGPPHDDAGRRDTGMDGDCVLGHAVGSGQQALATSNLSAGGGGRPGKLLEDCLLAIGYLQWGLARTNNVIATIADQSGDTILKCGPWRLREPPRSKRTCARTDRRKRQRSPQLGSPPCRWDTTTSPGDTMQAGFNDSVSG